MNPLEVLDVLSRIGVLGVTTILIFLILSGRLVTKGHLDEIKDQLAKSQGEMDAKLDRIESAVNVIRNHRP